VKIFTKAITAIPHTVKDMMTLKLDQQDHQWQRLRPSCLPRSGLVHFSYEFILSIQFVASFSSISSKFGAFLSPKDRRFSSQIVLFFYSPHVLNSGAKERTPEAAVSQSCVSGECSRLRSSPVRLLVLYPGRSEEAEDSFPEAGVLAKRKRCINLDRGKSSGRRNNGYVFNWR
jgi:hypothetical protein